MSCRRAFLAALIALPPGVASASGRRRDEQERARQALAEGRIRPLSDILATLDGQLGGRVLDVELDEEDGRFVYEIKVVTPRGRRREIEVDAATGRILKVDD